jgi:hypothetical protein
MEIVDIGFGSVFKGDWKNLLGDYMTQINRDNDFSPYVALARFERLPDFPTGHGPENINLLFARCEAITTVRSVYNRRKIAPRCLAYVRSGIGFGGNFPDFPKKMCETLRDKLPEYIFYDLVGGDPNRGDYLELIQNYNLVKRWITTKGGREEIFTLGHLI